MKKTYIVGSKSVELCIDVRQESNIDIMIPFMNELYLEGKYDAVTESNDHNHRIGIYSIHTWAKIHKAYSIKSNHLVPNGFND